MHPLEQIGSHGKMPAAGQHASQIAGTVDTTPGDATARAGNRHDQIAYRPGYGRNNAGGRKLGNRATRTILPTAHEVVTHTSKGNC